VTSTGFTVPPLSAHFVKSLPLRRNCQRLDLVGMGCNAGVNALAAVRNWCLANPGKTAALVCSEICSAIYDVDAAPETALANSLFGDGVAAVLLRYDDGGSGRHARVLRSESLTIPEHIDALRFNWQEERNRFGFFIDRKTPIALAANIEEPLGRLLASLQLDRRDVHHWVFHSGGAAILDLVEKKLELPPDALRFTRSTLRHFGNLSSASVFFTYEELMRKGNVRPGDRGIMVAMGPGLAIEAAALQW
jgi:predicted naringenin-chalcone synthase